MDGRESINHAFLSGTLLTLERVHLPSLVNF